MYQVPWRHWSRHLERVLPSVRSPAFRRTPASARELPAVLPPHSTDSPESLDPKDNMY